MLKKQLTISRKISAEIIEDFKVHLPYCAEEIIEFHVSNVEHLQIDYSCREEKDVPRIEETIRKLLDLLCGENESHSTEIKKRTIFDHRSVTCRNQKDIFDDLLAGGHLIPFGLGQYGLGKTFLKIYKYFERESYRLAQEQNAEEYVYPNMIPMDYLKQCDYFATFPHFITFISHLRQDLGVISDFSEQYQKDNFYFLKYLQQPAHVCKSAVCLHCYPQFKNKIIPKNEPVTLTAQGSCFRYESGNIKTMERLWEFNMREIVYLGDMEFVKNSLEKIRSKTAEWMVRLGLHCWIETANDPFFANNIAILKKFQLMKETKHELRLTLPHENTSIAAASFNFHGPHYSKAFNITDGKGYVTTGCMGYGLERLTYAFLCQYGLQSDEWPTNIRDEVLTAG